MGNDENTLQIRKDRCVRQPALIDVDFITPQDSLVALLETLFARVISSNLKLVMCMMVGSGKGGGRGVAGPQTKE